VSTRARVSLLALCLVLLVVGLAQPDPARQLGATTFGTGPNGYGGVFDVFTALGLPVARSYDPPRALPSAATVWWIEPDGVCRSSRESSPDDAGVEDWSGEEWIAAGGTAIVFLTAADTGLSPCHSIAGIEVPARTDAAPATGRRAQPVSQEVSGPLTAGPRRIEAPDLRAFTDAGGAEVLASVAERPFVLQHHVGHGRLVLVADPQVLRNQWLDRGDAAPLAMDFVRAFGVPQFDERSHGLHRERAPLRFLLHSAALPALVGALVLGLLAVWYGQAVPPRRAADDAAAAPTLATFVDALARLYAGTGDHARVLARYRQLTAARMRRHFSLPPETPLAALLDRLARTRRVSPERLAVLSDERTVASAAELRAAARALDAALEEAIQ
jgi:hypothetical protein